MIIANSAKVLVSPVKLGNKGALLSGENMVLCMFPDIGEMLKFLSLHSMKLSVEKEWVSKIE